MYISRTIENKVKELTKEFKVLVVTGARQVGKSHRYFSIEIQN